MLELDIRGMWPRACLLYGRVGLVGTLVMDKPPSTDAPICKELRVECVYLQGCLQGT